MHSRSLFALVLVGWLALLGQVSASVQMAEQLHQLGVEISISSTTAEQHQQGHCFTGLLSAIAVPLLLVLTLLLASASHPAKPQPAQRANPFSCRRWRHATRGPPLSLTFA